VQSWGRPPTSGVWTMTVQSDEHERTLAFAEIALGQIKALRQPAAPRIYEVWYIYATYISPTHVADEVDAVNSKIIEEIDQVMALIDSAVGSANKHDASLADVTTKLGRANDRDAARGILESLVQTAADIRRD